MTLPASEAERFLIELEFIQNLSNPKYLQQLANGRHFNDPNFTEYLKYLRYFKEPKYLRHVVFPQCLAVLDALIENPAFVKALSNPQFIDELHLQQGLFWQYRLGEFDVR
jgi:mediator of RNA polymerase II transcription subunit 31